MNAGGVQILIAVLSGSTLIAMIVGLIKIGRLIEMVERHERDIAGIWARLNAPRGGL